MAYIGNSPIIGNFQKCDALTASSTASYTLQVGGTNVSPESVNHMLVSLNGILQAPTTSFTVSGSTLTFASALTSSDSIDFVILLGNVLDLGVPSDSTVTLGKLTATGTASSSTFLRGDNSWAVPSGGKIGQVVSTAKTDVFTTTSTSFTDITGLTVDITPSATSSKVFVMSNFQVRCDAASGYFVARMLRDSSVINAGATAGNRVGGFISANIYNADNQTGMSVSTAFLDSPSTTSATTYKIQMKSTGGNDFGVGSINGDHDSTHNARSASVITVMEGLA